MRPLLKVSLLGICFALVLLLDMAPLHIVGDAHAVYGVRRRTARRTAVVVGSAAAAETAAAQQEAAAANQRADAAEQEAAAAQAEAETAKQQAAASEAEAEAAKQQAAAASGALPIGAVVTALPAGCNTTTINGVEYYYNGVNYYRAAFQGDQLIYVTAQP